MDRSDVFTAPVTAELLGQIGLFGGLGPEQLERLASVLRAVTYEPGDVVFREGEHASEMYVVLSGEFEVLKKSQRGVAARVAIFGLGDWFGEMSILDVQPRSATIRALAPSRLLVLATADLDALYRSDLRAYALLVLNIARELTRRLRVADSILADLVISLTDELATRRHGSSA